MSDAIETTSCIRHRENARYFVYHEDYQEIAPGKHADKVAALLRVLEVKTNRKITAYSVMMEEYLPAGKKLPPLNLWIESSYNDFVHWSLHTMGRSSFQIADKEAERLLLVKSRVRSRHINPDDPASPEVPYKEYLLVRENVQAAIDGKEAPITGKAYEEYGETPPVIENIPLLKKTRDMLISTREGMLKKTRSPVENNSNERNKKSNLSKTNVERKNEVVPDQELEETIILSDEEQSFHDLYYGSEIALGEPTEITTKKKAYYEELAPYVQTLEALMSLYAYAQAHIRGNDKTVYLGNLAKSRKGWWQTQTPVTNSQDEDIYNLFRRNRRSHALDAGKAQ